MNVDKVIIMFGTNDLTYTRTDVFVNEYLASKQTEWGFTFINLYSSVVDSNGNIRPEYCSDRYVHHNSRCYSEAWEPTLKAIAVKSIAAKRNK